MSLEHLRPYLELDVLCPNPVFIIGSPRSGTTALGHALNRHPELWASKESYLLHQLYGGGRVAEAVRKHWQRANPSWLRAENVETPELLGFLGVGINALYSSRSGGRRWVDPTPLNTPMVDELADMFPGACFIHVLRDGRFVARSMGQFRATVQRVRGPIAAEETPAWTRDFRKACATWSDYVQTALRFEVEHPDRCLTLRNEALVADAPSAFTRIWEFLGVAAASGPAKFLSRARVNSSFRFGSRRPSDVDWRDWTPEQRAEFVEIAGQTLVDCGYVTAEELERWERSGVIASDASGTSMRTP
jgi:hypothetical protein